MWLFAHDSLVAVRTDRDNLDWCLKLSLKELDVVVKLLWELLLACKLGHVGLPSRQLCVNRLNALVDVVWEIVDLLAVLLVSHASLDGVEAVEHVALHHDKLCYAVQHI